MIRETTVQRNLAARKETESRGNHSPSNFRTEQHEDKNSTDSVPKIVSRLSLLATVSPSPPLPDQSQYPPSPHSPVRNRWGRSSNDLDDAKLPPAFRSALRGSKKAAPILPKRRHIIDGDMPLEKYASCHEPITRPPSKLPRTSFPPVLPQRDIDIELLSKSLSNLISQACVQSRLGSFEGSGFGPDASEHTGEEDKVGALAKKQHSKSSLPSGKVVRKASLRVHWGGDEIFFIKPRQRKDAYFMGDLLKDRFAAEKGGHGSFGSGMILGDRFESRRGDACLPSCPARAQNSEMSLDWDEVVPEQSRRGDVCPPSCPARAQYSEPSLNWDEGEQSLRGDGCRDVGPPSFPARAQYSDPSLNWDEASTEQSRRGYGCRDVGPPSFPTRAQYSEPSLNWDEATSSTEQSRRGGVGPPSFPARAQYSEPSMNWDEADPEEQQSVSDNKTLSSSCPFIWVTTLDEDESTSTAGITWRVKRALDDPAWDKLEEEHLVKDEELMDMVKVLVGVGTMPSEEAPDRVFSSAEEDPHYHPALSLWKVKKFYAIDGEIDSSESEKAVDEHTMMCEFQEMSLESALADRVGTNDNVSEATTTQCQKKVEVVKEKVVQMELTTQCQGKGEVVKEKVEQMELTSSLHEKQNIAQRKFGNDKGKSGKKTKSRARSMADLFSSPIESEKAVVEHTMLCEIKDVSLESSLADTVGTTENGSEATTITQCEEKFEGVKDKGVQMELTSSVDGLVTSSLHEKRSIALGKFGSDHGERRNFHGLEVGGIVKKGKSGKKKKAKSRSRSLLDLLAPPPVTMFIDHE
jgi:hypothetical protein